VPSLAGSRLDVRRHCHHVRVHTEVMVEVLVSSVAAAENDMDGSFDLMFGSVVIALILAGYALSTMWANFVPMRRAMMRSLSCASLSEMSWSARTACITMLGEFDARSDPIAAAAKEAKSQRVAAKKSSMPRVPSMPTLLEVDDEWKNCDLPLTRRSSSSSARVPLTRVSSLPSIESNDEEQVRHVVPHPERREARAPCGRQTSNSEVEARGRNTLEGGYTTRSASPIPTMGETPNHTASISEEIPSANGKALPSKAGEVPSPSEVEWEPPMAAHERMARHTRNESTHRDMRSNLDEAVCLRNSRTDY